MTDERKFLHDMASTVTSMAFAVTAMRTLLEAGTAQDLEKVRALVDRQSQLLEKSETLITQRREILRASE